jgi:hypothetical protein
MLLAKLKRALIKHPVYVLLLTPAFLLIVKVLKQVDEILKKLNLNIIKVLYLKSFLLIPRRVKRKDSIKCIIVKHNLSCNSIYNIFKVDEIFNIKEKVLLECLIKELYYKTKYLIIKVLAHII